MARFDGGTISSDGGAFLLRQVDKRLNLLARFGQCFLDGRNQALVEHSIPEMVSQRVYGLALGYEDLNDHEQLRTDPVFGILAGKQDMTEPLAGKSTLNRMELGTGINNRYKKITFWKEAVDQLLVNAFIESHDEAPAEIVLDMDTTDMPLHGKQEGRFFHGYYDAYCYLPLYVFCGDHVLCARMREANHDAAFGCRQEMERIVKQIRAAWPGVKIVLRGDSGFCRNELMSWCESNGVDFVFGLARNKRLRKIIGLQMHQATMQWAAQALYEELYCERGNMENRIKEQFSLFADRVSAETIRANQIRLYLSAMAYILVSGLRRVGLKGTELAQAEVCTIRTKLLKIGAQIRVSVRKVWVSLASSYPWQGLYRQVWSNLRC